MNPEFEDETAVNLFDFWEGADLKLKIRNVEGYRNYDKSEFAEPSPLLDGDDDKLEKVYESMFSLQEFLDRKTSRLTLSYKQSLTCIRFSWCYYTFST